MLQTNDRLVFDRTTALERLDGDVDFLKELAGLLLEQCDSQLDQLAEAVAQRDADAVMKLAHTLKGGVANVSAERVYEAAQKIELNARRGDLSCVDGEFGELRDELEGLKTALREFIGESA